MSTASASADSQMRKRPFIQIDLIAKIIPLWSP
jgi:hypothetical protein